jgi:hypothetical protein
VTVREGEGMKKLTGRITYCAGTIDGGIGVVVWFNNLLFF